MKTKFRINKKEAIKLFTVAVLVALIFTISILAQDQPKPKPKVLGNSDFNTLSRSELIGYAVKIVKIKTGKNEIEVKGCLSSKHRPLTRSSVDNLSVEQIVKKVEEENSGDAACEASIKYSKNGIKKAYIRYTEIGSPDAFFIISNEIEKVAKMTSNDIPKSKPLILYLGKESKGKIYINEDEEIIFVTVTYESEIPTGGQITIKTRTAIPKLRKLFEEITVDPNNLSEATTSKDMDCCTHYY